ncbi:Pyruvate/Phosphoenolpyruvate kinase-like domain-containing protein [Truncatella angustata]|uniref:Pyruvate/Phosphoenolpyruvate kinase-like domain-containing protein n=1 Tax=Truncatella angustata TaxID=152316 RepID=A0A9P8UEM1_9PEZI|nr:Pyruvate/Phosphoenolpyruvate kinase-like domain-containing protein [Truncatella angustata]KAH6648521.1 Pyruvate/Phosphoenolpyruvate kinase-like domain-containing protein [Truncatella angustata]
MAAKSSAILRRALLYVPSSSPRMLTKSLSLKSDNVTYDLEDSVTPNAKPEARRALREHLSQLSSRPPSISELAIRINAISTPHALEDLTSLAPLPRLDAIVIPKVNSASDLTFATDALRHLAPERHAPGGGSPVKLIALIESAQAIMNLREICSASPYLSGLIFAAEDFALDLSITRTPSLSEFLYARSAIATAARAAELPSTIDLVCTSYKGEEGLKRLEEECQGGKAMGFNGKQCIHPSQVETVQRLFAPGDKEVEWAVRVVIADEKAANAGRGAWTLDGAMIDAPVVGKARAIVTKAEACEIDVTSIREKWKEQEPE